MATQGKCFRRKEYQRRRDYQTGDYLRKESWEDGLLSV
jgi:hypothetical protein